ncbi:MAG: UDP-N-acetylmuramate:L-alanyl-gamma-D-glutamyl-meso-diaminopimelate ligase [Polyangiaceae bacterium]|nr:UDP-N-acetylmuramate:L-alanyl-gamma-D-glutamyl-meso-diaminopimelate ligase [Polyangiaceae bacterium]
MRVHFVAVAGTGMGALAGLFLEAGHEVSGSDAAFDPPMGPALASWGVRCLTGFDPAHLSPPPDLVVIGNVCRRDNPEARAAIDGGLAYTDMAHALGERILPGRSPLVVAGTHGKTTTSAMCAYLLERAGREPGFLIGGLPKDFPASYRLGRARRVLVGPSEARRGPPFVVEGDEYDTAFFEKTPKCWHYRPEVAILTSIEHDHVDIYPTEASYLDAFRGFVARVPASGLIVAAAADPRVRALVAGVEAEVATFALDGDDTGQVPPDYLAAIAVRDAQGTTFDLFAGGSACGRFALRVPGEHNVRNAVAAIVAAVHGFGVSFEAARAALPGFSGVRRRQDLLGAPGGVSVYDDFAHHPTAVDETLRALASKHRGARLCAVFEPRSATACRAMHQEAYARAFGAAARVIVAPRGRATVDGDALDLARLVDDLRAGGVDATSPGDLDGVVGEVAAWAREGDVVALLSNGAFGGVPARVVAALEGRG